MHIPMTEIDDDEVVQDGEAVTVPFFLRDGETLPQLRERIAQSQTLDAYQCFSRTAVPSGRSNSTSCKRLQTAPRPPPLPLHWSSVTMHG